MTSKTDTEEDGFQILPPTAPSRIAEKKDAADVYQAVTLSVKTQVSELSLRRRWHSNKRYQQKLHAGRPTWSSRAVFEPSIFGLVSWTLVLLESYAY